MYDRFLTLRLRAPRPAADRGAPRPADLAPAADAAEATGDRVLARVPGELRRDALVVTRTDDGFAVRRVGRLTDDQVELLPVDAPERDAAPVERVARDDDRVVGTVLLRWDGV